MNHSEQTSQGSGRLERFKLEKAGSLVRQGSGCKPQVGDPEATRPPPSSGQLTHPALPPLVSRLRLLQPRRWHQPGCIPALSPSPSRLHSSPRCCLNHLFLKAAAFTRWKKNRVGGATAGFLGGARAERPASPLTPDIQLAAWGRILNVFLLGLFS